MRVHRRELVCLDCIRALHGEGASSHLELTDGTRVSVSRRNLPELRRRLGLV